MLAPSWLRGHLLLLTTSLRGHLLLLITFFRGLGELCRLPTWLTLPGELTRRLDTVAEGATLTLSLPSHHADTYNSLMASTASSLRSLHPPSNPPTTTSPLPLLLLLRVVMVVSAWHGCLHTTLALTVLQILLAPYALLVSLFNCISLLPLIYVPHYLSFAALQLLASALDCPAVQWARWWTEVQVSVPLILLAILVRVALLGTS